MRERHHEHGRRRLARGALALVAGALLVSALFALPGRRGAARGHLRPRRHAILVVGRRRLRAPARTARRTSSWRRATRPSSAAPSRTPTATRTSVVTKFLGSVKQWTRLWSGPSHLYDTADGLALSADGKWIYVAGTHAEGRTGPATSRSSSARRAAARSNGRGPTTAPSTRSTWPTAVGVDGSGNVVVAGHLRQLTAFVDLVVVSWTSSRSVRRWTWQVRRRRPTDSTCAQGADGGDATARPTSPASPSRWPVPTHGGDDGQALRSRRRRSGSRPTRDPTARARMATSVTRRPGGGVYVCGGVRRVGGHSDGVVLGYARVPAPRPSWPSTTVRRRTTSSSTTSP